MRKSETIAPGADVILPPLGGPGKIDEIQSSIKTDISVHSKVLIAMGGIVVNRRGIGQIRFVARNIIQLERLRQNIHSLRNTFSFNQSAACCPIA